MKIILNIFCCFLINSVVAQLRETYFQMPNRIVRILPYLSNESYTLEPNDVPYQQQADSILGGLIIVHNPLYNEPKNSVKYETNNPYCYLYYPYFQSTDLPPFLDSLIDGTYVQYYDKLPIRDVDTVKWNDKVVAAIFEVKNNRPEGEVRWYYPNGLLMQTGSYKNGFREGEWFYQGIRNTENVSKKQKDWFYEHSSTTHYLNGKKTGLEYLQNQLTSTGKHKPVIGETWMNYKENSPHGKYEYQINGKTRTIGEYTNGKESGKWIQYQWKDSIEHGKLIPRLIYTYSKDTIPTIFPAYFRNEFKHKSYKRPYYGESAYASPLNSDDNFVNSYIDKSIGENFQNYFYTPNCSHLSTGYSFDPNYVQPYFYLNQDFLRDSLNERHYYRDVIDTCGIHFFFSGVVEEYYSNGQLKLRFDFDHPETILNNTVYWENGKPMNTFRKTNVGNGWEELWYTEKGEIIEHRIYDSLFQLKSKPIDPNYVIFNERLYTVHGNEIWYTNTSAFLYSQTEPQLKEEKRILKGNALHEQFYFYPSRRTGYKALYLEKPYKNVKWFTFDSTFTASHFIDTVSFGDLFSIVEINDSIRNDYWYKYYQPLKNDTIHNSVVALGDFSAAIKMRTLQYDGKPYTGKLKIEFRKHIQPRISKTKNELVISIDRTTDLMLVYAFFPNLAHIIEGNSLAYITEFRYEEYKKVLPELELTTIELNLKDGILNGELNCFAPKKRPLASMQYVNGVLSGKETYYNNFPDSFRGFKSGYFSRGFQEDEVVENFKRTQITKQVNRLNGVLNGENSTLNLNGDTLCFNNYQNGKLEGEQFGVHEKYYREYFVYKNEKIISQRKVGSRTQKTLMDWSSETGIYRSYYKYGQLAQEAIIHPDQKYDTIRCYDTVGVLIKELCLTNQVLDYAIFYENGERSMTLDFEIEDTLVYPFCEEYKIFYPITRTIIHSKRVKYIAPLDDHQYSAYIKRYNQYNELEEEGNLYNGLKVGKWNYYQSDKSGYYSIVFADSSNFYNRNDQHREAEITYYNAEGKLISNGQLVNFSQEYSCLQRNYTEQFLVNYSLLNEQIPPDSLYPIKHYYKTGIKMNEGNLLNGEAHGLWRCYHSDGSLYELGNYENGKRHGRWLKGDLSQINFLGEYCLDPENADFKSLLSEIDVTVIYYDHGKITDVQEHHFRGTK